MKKTNSTFHDEKEERKEIGEEIGTYGFQKKKRISNFILTSVNETKISCNRQYFINSYNLCRIKRMH